MEVDEKKKKEHKAKHELMMLIDVMNRKMEKMFF